MRWVRLGLLFVGIHTCFFGQINSLKTVSVPDVPGLEKYVRDRSALLVLGKALFWDMQVGSDGRTACATCHFHAGADHRVQNQLSNPTGTFQPNYRLMSQDFPFRKFDNDGDNHSTVLRDSSQRTGSAGMFRRAFTGLGDSAAEHGTDGQETSGFQIAGLNLRQVTTRNAPTVINAALHVRGFRDGRASDVFTGRTPFGDSDPRANAVAVVNGQVTQEMVRLPNSSLASQAMAPPVNPVEMSYDGRTWPVIAHKLLGLRPLAAQGVAPDDSVLGSYVSTTGPGLAAGISYLSLVQTAFQSAYWDSDQRVDDTGHSTPAGYTVAEFNFPIFFGLAVQAYETTLIADDSRFDQYMDGSQRAITAQEYAGFLVYQTRAFCQFCHQGPELSNATFTFEAKHGPVQPVLTNPDDMRYLFADSGFFHTGVRPAVEDPGLNALDDFQNPISIAARSAAGPLDTAGAFKVPGLRNAEFTGPYFHNGGQASLEQVIDFYVRGGDFPDPVTLPVEIMPFPFTPADSADLIAFLKSLSDDRVRYERAPFDHPELCVPVGYPDAPSADPAFPQSAVDKWAGIPAVGKSGNTAPLQTFDELLKGVGVDGSRTHTLTDPCKVQ
jgi:cytochrome c peroxidase